MVQIARNDFTDMRCWGQGHGTKVEAIQQTEEAQSAFHCCEGPGSGVLTGEPGVHANSSNQEAKVQHPRALVYAGRVPTCVQARGD